MLLQPLPPPVQPKEIGAPPQGEDWVYEFLWNGERIRAVKDEFGVRLLTRDGRNVVNRFPRVAAAVAKLRATDAVIDGEILMLDSYSPAAVGFLSRVSDDISQAQVALLAYDLLQYAGENMREMPLLGRRFVLTSMVQATPILVSPLFNGSSEDALAEAARMGLPGIVAKRAGSCYRPNALATPWLKVLLGSSVPAEGRTRSRGSRPPFVVPISSRSRMAGPAV
jgi:bifunctional non-homologous end joining protein LigD